MPDTPDLSDPLFRHELRDRLAHALEYIVDDIKGHATGRSGSAPRHEVFLFHRAVDTARRRIVEAQVALERIEDHFSDTTHD